MAYSGSRFSRQNPRLGNLRYKNVSFDLEFRDEIEKLLVSVKILTETLKIGVLRRSF